MQHGIVRKYVWFITYVSITELRPDVEQSSFDAVEFNNHTSKYCKSLSARK